MTNYRKKISRYRKIHVTYVIEYIRALILEIFKDKLEKTHYIKKPGLRDRLNLRDKTRPCRPKNPAY